MVRRVFTATAVTLILSASSMLAAAPATGAGASIRMACAHPGRFQCRAEVVVWPKQSSTGGSISPSTTTPTGYTAAQLQAIYQTTGVVPAGGSPTIAVIDAYDYPSAESDLAAYRNYMGLPACTVASGCLSIVNQTLQPGLPNPSTPGDDWSLEAALDLDMASAICPDCHLMLVEAQNDIDGNNLVAAAVNAATVTHYVSMSWGGPDSPTISTDTFNQPGIVHTIFTAASGDNGYSSTPDFPSTYTNVVAVGGTSLSTVGGTPSAWSGAGSSCSDRMPQPAPQTTLTSLTGVCSYKAASDLSALADPFTGVAVYDTYNNNGGWNQVGGTSASAPMVAALYALVGNHTDPWAGYATMSTYPSLMKDVASGSNGSCTNAMCDSGTSWDGPTGIGTPLTPEALALPLGTMTMTIGGLHAKSQAPFDLPVSLPTTVPDTAGTPQALATADASVTGLPAGLTWSVSNGTLDISGTPTTPGSGTATISLTGSTPAGRTASGTVSVSWTVALATLVPDANVQIGGHRSHGRWAHVVLPTVYTNSLAGAEVSPTWKVKWFLNGTLVHVGLHYHLPDNSAGETLRVRAHARLAGYSRLILKSAHYTVH